MGTNSYDSDCNVGTGSIKTFGISVALLLASVSFSQEVQAQSTATISGETVAKVYTVSDRYQLRTALMESLKMAGAEIRLLPGNYGELTWTNKKHLLGKVYLVAAASEMPVFTYLNFSGSQGVAVHSVRVQSDKAVLVNLGGKDLSLSGSVLTSAVPDMNPWNNGNTGIHIRGGTKVTVQDVKFEDLRLATFVQRSKDVKFRYNTVRFMREGMNVAATDGILIERNYFTEFHPNYARGEHPDTVQFWNVQEEVGVSNARLIENVMIHGGCRAVQGLFLGAERALQRHHNLEIRGNVYYGSSPHGIAVTRVDGLKMSNNVVVSSPWADRNNSIRSTDGKCSGGYAPRMRVNEGTDVEAWNNVGMTTPQLAPGNKFDNWDIYETAYGGLAWTDVFLARPTADIPPLSAFVSKDPSLARTRAGGILAAYPHGARTLSVSEGLRQLIATHSR